MKKKIIILGAGIYQLPAIKKAKEMGLYVITVDNEPKNIGHRLSDLSENISTINKEKILESAKKHKIDGIMTIASDVSVPTVAYVASILNLFSITPKQADIVCDKNQFCRFLRSNNFPCPRFMEATTLKQAEEFFKNVNTTCFIKPTDRSGSKAVGIIKSQKMLKKKFNHATDVSLKGSACIQEYLEGIEVGCETFSVNGKAIIILTNKTNNNYVVKMHSVPCKLDKKTISETKKLVQKVLKKLGILWGPVNMDIIITKKGPYIIDIGARIGGNCLPQIVNLSTGIDTVKMAIEVALGKKPKLPNKINAIPIGTRIFGTSKSGVLKDFVAKKIIKKHFPQIEEIETKRRGKIVTAFTEGKNRLGHVIIRDTNVQEVERNLISIEKALSFQVKN